MEHDSRARFLPTQWTLVEALRAPDEAVRREAMEALARQYWPPVYAHLRRSGRSRDDAAELTQSFFGDVVLSRGLFERADSSRFRLRTLLLHALQNYIVDDHRRHSKSPALVTIPMDQVDEEELLRSQWLNGRNSDAAPDPADEFDRRWAQVVLQEALSRCERNLEETGRQRHWALFEATYLQSRPVDPKKATIAAMAKELGFDSYTDAIVALRSTRKKLAVAFIPQILAETNSNPSDREDEYELMLALLP